MLEAVKKKLEDILVRILSENAALSAESLYRELKRRKGSYTLQALYKELRKLQQQGVVVRARGLYSLRLSWILSLTNLADRAYATCIDSPFPEELLPESEKRVKWAFNDMNRADDFYMQVLTKLLLAPSAPAAYTAMEHPWFLFMNTQNELNHQRVLEQERKKQFVVLENDTPLDRAQVHLYDNISIKFAFSPELGICTTYSIVSAIGDFVLSEKLPARARSGFAEVYGKTRSMKDLNFKTITRICNTTGPSSVILERNPEKSRFLIKKLERFF